MPLTPHQHRPYSIKGIGRCHSGKMNARSSYRKLHRSVLSERKPWKYTPPPGWIYFQHYLIRSWLNPPPPPYQHFAINTQGDGKTALKGVCRASLRLSRSSALRFSSGLFLHLAAEACFTTLEQDMLPPGPAPRRRVFAAARLLVRTLGRFARVN